jgi:hypothetical protein
MVIAVSAPARAEVILEDKGLYKKDTWSIGKYYDDLGNPNDGPGVVTSGKDPRYPSGPAVDFGNAREQTRSDPGQERQSQQ